MCPNNQTKSPEHGVLIPVCKLAKGIADFQPLHALAVELGTHVLQRPLTGIRPIDLAALGIELAAVFGHQTDADQIDGVWSLDELGVDPIFHALLLLGANPARPRS